MNNQKKVRSQKYKQQATNGDDTLKNIMFV